MSMWIISRGVVLLILLMLGISFKFGISGLLHQVITTIADRIRDKDTSQSKQNLQSSSMTFIYKTLIIPSVLDSCFSSSTVCEVKRYSANVRRTVADFSHAPPNEYSPSPNDKKQWSSKLEYKFQDQENSEDIFSFGRALKDFICVVFILDRNIKSRGGLDEDPGQLSLKEFTLLLSVTTDVDVIISRGVVLLILLMEYKFQVWNIGDNLHQVFTDNSLQNTRLVMKKAFSNMLHELGEVNLTHAYYNESCISKDIEDPSWSTSFKTRRTQKTSSALEEL
ncbi:hypothetical protein Tco_0629227 [Tanacetum coccineum]|uniref:Uncharacterized protein n=1 Tax=Tanacetum coccineum TaxID=301880 RepID=A0ABQ4WSJ4_9ASTR